MLPLVVKIDGKTMRRCQWVSGFGRCNGVACKKMVNIAGRTKFLCEYHADIVETEFEQDALLNHKSRKEQ